VEELVKRKKSSEKLVNDAKKEAASYKKTA
jgi:hypothetical protein